MSGYRLVAIGFFLDCCEAVNILGMITSNCSKMTDQIEEIPNRLR